MFGDICFVGLFGDINHLQEFMMATDMTASGSPEEKLRWAFKMYDKDGSGAITFKSGADSNFRVNCSNIVDYSRT